MSLSPTALRILATPIVSPGVEEALRAVRTPRPRQVAVLLRPLAGTPLIRLPFSASSALFHGKADPIRLALAKIDRELGDVVAELRIMKLAPPPKGAVVITPRLDAALTGLPGELFLGYDRKERKVLRSFEPLLMPRLPLLPTRLRGHEGAFADQFAGKVHKTLERYKELVGNSKVFGVDLAKRLYASWGSGKHPANDDERVFRAEANLALHQTAVAIAKLAFLHELDEIADKRDEDAKAGRKQPEPRIIITIGGSGAGKGRLRRMLDVAMPDLKVDAIFDVAGEGEARECAALLAECKERKLHVDFVYFHKPVEAAAVRVVQRTFKSGRMVDVLSTVRGHLRGADVVRSFVVSPEFQAQQRAGKARAYGVSNGMEVLDPDPMALRFPFTERLDKDGRLTVPNPNLSEPQAVLAVLTELAAARRKGLSEEAVRGGLMGLAVVWPDYFDSLGLKLFERAKKAA